MDRETDALTRLFAGSVRRMLERSKVELKDVQEIRLRTGLPLVLVRCGEEFFLTAEGGLTREPDRAYRVREADIRETMECVGDYSLYAYEEELRQGFLTVRGGHRVGVAGKVILEGQAVRGIRCISCVNLRIAHQVRGCARQIFPLLFENGEFCHTLLVSAPRCGKTTMLRDLIRMLSDGAAGYAGRTVGVVDERSEIAGCYLGVPQNDVGIRTDVLDGCPKAEGMMMLIRSMAPEVVAVDEIGTKEDIRALEAVLNCGCRLLATVHGLSLEDLRQKPVLRELVEQGVFQRYVQLTGPPGRGGTVTVRDRAGDVRYQGKGA